MLDPFLPLLEPSHICESDANITPKENIENILHDSAQKIEHEEQQCVKDYEALAHPFTRNNLVLGVIFGFLDVDSLKQCRLVNKTWKEICDPIFEKEVQFCFSGLTSSYQSPISNFNENMLLGCSAYKFDRTEFDLSDYSRMLHHKFTMLTSLTLLDIVVHGEDGEFDRFSIEGLLGENNFQLKKLVVCCFSGHTRILIPVEKLSSEIEYLDLECCVVIAKDGHNDPRCSPKHIKLFNILLEDDSEGEFEEFLVNDIISCRNAEEIFIWQSLLISGPKFHLNLIEPTEEIINRVVVFRGRCGRLQTNEFSKINELRTDYEHFDLSTLPNSLESLSFFASQHQNIETESIPPNLKYLTCTFTESVPFLFKFSICSLKFVHLDALCETSCDLSWLPPTLETLILDKINVTVCNENNVSSLTDLIIIDCPTHCILNTVSRLKPQNIYLWFKSEEMHEKLEITIQIHRRRYYGKFFRVALFFFRHARDFNNHPISQIVDRPANSYSFELDLDQGKGNTGQVDIYNTIQNIRRSGLRACDLSVIRDPLMSPHFLKPHWKISVRTERLYSSSES